MLKKQAAELLGVTPARVSQLIRDGGLTVEPDGTITPEAVERCRRARPWQHPEMRSGRRSAEARERERRNHLWHAVALKMGAKGYKGWQAWNCREAWRDLKGCIAAVEDTLLGD